MLRYAAGGIGICGRVFWPAGRRSNPRDQPRQRRVVPTRGAGGACYGRQGRSQSASHRWRDGEVVQAEGTQLHRRISSSQTHHVSASAAVAGSVSHRRFSHDYDDKGKGNSITLI